MPTMKSPARASAWKPLEIALTVGARALWPAFQFVNRRVTARSFQPKWADGPAPQESRTDVATAGLAAHDRLALPDLRPRDARGAFSRASGASNRSSTSTSAKSRRTSSSATARSLIEKTCPQHGTFTDVLADQPGVSRSASSACFPGATSPSVTDTLHNHGTSSIKYGRGAVLTIDLTNRCNMMCDPCFMDANQVGYVHELTLRRGQEDSSTTRSPSSRAAR